MMADQDIFDKKKGHQARHAGRKADKKSAKKPHVQDLTSQQRNPKAFTFHSAVKAQRQFVRTQDIKSKKHHIPVVDRTPVEPPPVVVAVVGGPKVGKSTLLRCLIKNYTRQRLTNILGPVTIVAGKKKRLTFLEVNNDINCMIDIAKIADIVLMLIDATFGIEMETFEFLEICRAHGTPRIMGVLNHLDMLRDNKALKKRKKALKQRFQVELYPGAKLFYLSGLIHGEYLKNEVKNLGRFISVMKFRPLTWRTTHPYVLVDRYEDITNPEEIRINAKCDRDIVLYGYVRGVPFHQDQAVHIPGCGDYCIKDLTFLPDPCPLPEHLKKRSLNAKERLAYAPMSGVGGVVYDKDAVYIDLGGSHHAKRSQHGEEGEYVEDNGGDGIFKPLLDLQQTANEKIAMSQIQLFSNSKLISNESISDDEEEEWDSNGKENFIKKRTVSEGLPEYETVTGKDGRIRRRVIFKDSLDEEDSGEDSSNEDEDCQEEDVYPDGIYPEQSDASEDSDEELKSPKKKSKIDKLIASQNSKDQENSGREDESDEYDIDADLSILIKSSTMVDKTNIHIEGDSKNEKHVPWSTKDVESHKLSIIKRDKDLDITTKIQGLIENITFKQNSVSKFKPASYDSGFSNNEDDSNEYASESSDDDKGEMKVERKRSPKEELCEGPGEDIDDKDKLKYRKEMLKQATENFYINQSGVSYLRKYIYGDLLDKEPEESDEEYKDSEVDGLFKRTKNVGVKSVDGQTQSLKAIMDQMDTSRYNPTVLRDWNSEELRDSIRDCFVTGEWRESENAQTLLKMDDEDDDIYGDFEDLEEGKKFSSAIVNKDQMDEIVAVPGENKEEKTALEKRLEKKRRLKEMFDSEYDDKGEHDHFESLKTEMSEQAQLNRSEFEGLDDDTRVQYEGFRPGLYVRMEFSKMPCEFITNFDATYPVIVGGLLKNESNMGYIRIRIKAHRWYPKILKNKDPLILSLGWRRFQTIMYYAKREDNFRMRSLKYARKYLHVEGMFWGPVTPVGSGFVALQNINDRMPDFRIAGNGVVMEADQSSSIVKKLKLLGNPEKILKKTAFIKDMFHSETEIAKFEGAKVQTQSGIRGLIKKARGHKGIFRATFEDVIKLSDVIVLKTWVPVEMAKFYSSVRTLLLQSNEKAKWQGMKTVAQIKKSKGIKVTPNPDSFYTPITERREYVPLPLRIPKKLQKALPYCEKPKITPRGKKAERVLMVKEPHEIEMGNFMKRLKTMMQEKMEKDEEEKMAKKKKFQKDIEEREHMRQIREKRKKAHACRFSSKKSGKKEDKSL